MLINQTLLRTWRPRSRTRKASQQISKDSSLMERNSRTAAMFLTTTFSTITPSTWSSNSVKVFRSSLRPSLAQRPHWHNDHYRRRVIRHYCKLENQDSREGRHPGLTAKDDLCRQGSRRRPNYFWLQHTKGVHPSLGPHITWRFSSWNYGDLCQDSYSKDFHPSCWTIRHLGNR